METKQSVYRAENMFISVGTDSLLEPLVDIRGTARYGASILISLGYFFLKRPQIFSAAALR